MHPDSSFVHCLERPDDPDGTALVLLHGTGGDETDLLPLGRRVAPHATLLGVRGRCAEKGVARWFRRLSAATFDQANVTAEAHAFAAFLPAVLRSHRLGAARTTFLGYSNGANFIAAVMLLHPDLVARAALLRAMPVLDAPPAPDLSRASVLTITGRSDPYGRYGPALNAMLRKLGAHLDARIIAADHTLTPEDVSIVTEWIASRDAKAEPPDRMKTEQP